LKEGALASSVSHDSHNIIAVGTDDESLLRAINLVIQSKGGIAVCSPSGDHMLPLPMAGLMSTDDGYLVAEQYKQVNKQAHQLGSTLDSPFMTLSFMALLVIPSLKLSDKGMFDGSTFSLIKLFHL
jgi:adenine deaminase